METRRLTNLEDHEREWIADRYRLVEQVGHGGSAVVYRAIDSRGGSQVAVKLLRTDVARLAMMVDRLAAEAVTMQVLRHPNIADVLDMGFTDDGLAYIVIEWLGGGSLQEKIAQSGVLGLEEALGLVQSVLAGLDVAHRRGIVHRDIKPANIMLTADGTPKIVDFGIARIPDSHMDTHSGQIMGSLRFMAPEQRIDANLTTPASDIYAVGGLLYFLHTGLTPVDLFVCGPDDERWLPVSELLRPILLRAMAFRQNERYRDAGEMAEALADLAIT